MSQTKDRGSVTAAKRTLLVEIGLHRLEADEWPVAGRACDRLQKTGDASSDSGWRYLRELDDDGHLDRRDGDTSRSTIYVLTESGLDAIQSRRPDLHNTVAADPDITLADETEPASLRDDDPDDETAHARAVNQMLRDAYEEGIIDEPPVEDDQ